MTCTLLVQQRGSGYAACVLGLASSVFEAESRDAAIAKATAEVRRMLLAGEIVRVEVEGPPEWANRHVGIFADVDNETWNQFQQAIKDYRTEVDADPNQF